MDRKYLDGVKFVEFLHSHGLPKEGIKPRHGGTIQRAIHRWKNDLNNPKIDSFSVQDLLDYYGLMEHDIPDDVWTNSSKKYQKRRDLWEYRARNRRQDHPRITNLLIRLPPATLCTENEKMWVVSLYESNPRRWHPKILEILTRVRYKTIKNWIEKYGRDATDQSSDSQDSEPVEVDVSTTGEGEGDSL